MAIIKLKRARNSLLNVSTLPPEILGDIFRWNVTVVGDMGRLEEGSHNFLFVCHHWFEVASLTPELWSSWGDNLRDWTKRHLRYPTAPLDLVLNGRQFKGGTLDYSLLNALKHRAARDTIRRVHLVSEDSELLDLIISPLTVNCEEIRSSSMVSFLLLDESEDTSVDISDLFAYHRFPKLQRLELVNCTISSWDLMLSRTSVLTILTLGFSYPSPNPTTPQLLSILDSNPALQEVSLSGYAVPDDGGNTSSSRAALHHLRELELVGDSVQQVFALLHRLDHPRNMDHLTVVLEDCDVTDISEIIGPYLRDYLRHRGRSQNGLGLFLSSDDHITLHVGDMGGIDFSSMGPAQVDNFMVIDIELNQILPKELQEEVALDFISYAPREEIVYFSTYGDPVPMEEMAIQLPYLKALHFEGTTLHVAFPKPSLDWGGMVFPSLQHISLGQVIARRGDWSPLTTFLARRSSSGNKLDTLEIIGPYNMRVEVEKSIKGMVREFRTRDNNRISPL